MQEKWWHKSVVYQIYPKSFNDTNGDGIGDIKGIIEKLDYLNTLGVDYLWISPLYKSPMVDNGYDISDYEDINPLYGTMADMDLLLLESKKRGIGILMDLVINHTSDQHPWFLESKKSKDNPYRDYYIWKDEPNDLGSTFGGKAWTYDDHTKQYYFHNFAKEQPDLNWDNPKIMDEITKMILFWMNKGVAGFRLDVIDLIGKDIENKITANGPTLHPRIKQLSEQTFLTKDILTVGETWGATPEIAKLYSDPARKELSMIFQFEHMTLDWGHYGKWTPKPLDFIQLKQTLFKWQQEIHPAWNSLFWNNHDLPRVVSRFGNPEQYHFESASFFAIMLHLMKGTPYIYQGEEIGMTNVEFDDLSDYDDIEIKNSYQDFVLDTKRMTKQDFMTGVYRMGRDNARTPMQWTDGNEAGFTTGKPFLKVNPNYKTINVEDNLKNKDSLFYVYQHLIKLRKNSPYSQTIVYGDFIPLDLNHKSIVAYQRTSEDYTLLVVGNYGEQPVQLPAYAKGKKVLFSNYKDQVDTLRPYEIIIFVE